MMYDLIKVFHIFSAAVFITSLAYCYYLWKNAVQPNEITIATYKIQMQTAFVILPTALLQLASGFTMISIKHENFSASWILASIIGFIIAIGTWFSFIYLLMFSQQFISTSLHSESMKIKLFRRIQSFMLFLCAMAILTIIFLMTNTMN